MLKKMVKLQRVKHAWVLLGAGSPEIDAEEDSEAAEGEAWVLLGAGSPEIDAEEDGEAVKGEAVKGEAWVL